MSSDTRKRAYDGAADAGSPKRQKLGQLSVADSHDHPSPPSLASITWPSLDHQSKSGLKRSIAIVLQHVGFDSATPEAMESYVTTVEACK